MKKTILIAVIVVAALFALYWLTRRRKACISLDAGKFNLRWDDKAIPHGDLNRIAGKYLDGDPQDNGYLVGGFFKGIDTYPQDGAAKYYQNELRAWAASKESLPYSQMITGELLCDN